MKCSPTFVPLFSSLRKLAIQKRYMHTSVIVFVAVDYLLDPIPVHISLAVPSSFPDHTIVLAFLLNLPYQLVVAVRNLRSSNYIFLSIHPHPHFDCCISIIQNYKKKVVRVCICVLILLLSSYMTLCLNKFSLSFVANVTDGLM